MIKAIVGILLSCCLVSSADTVIIERASQLIEWFNDHYGDTNQVVIELAADIDFHSTGLKYPLGVFQGSCHPFSGSFKGREHRIKGLVMDNKNDNTYSSAGLFCGLKGAIVDDLVIDESCKFTGVSAGALSVKVIGDNSVNLLNIENKAQVNGDHGVGGLIGFVNSKVGGKVFLERCINTGDITATESDAGGLIGNIESTQSTEVVFENSTNKGVVNGAQVAGGFLGFLQNNGNVKITVNRSTNDNAVEGKNYIGGFLGYVERANEVSEWMIQMTNSINRGVVKGEKMACGFFCSIDSESDAPTALVYNSLNYGAISGSDAYGFAPYVTNSANDLSLGTVNGTHYSASFWKTAKTNHTLVTTEELCKNCDGAVWAIKNKDGIYDVTRTKMHIHDMLNWVVVTEQNWKSLAFWNSKLEFQENDGQANLGHSLNMHFSVISLVFFIIIQGIFSQ